MTDRDAATRVADLEDRVVTDLCPKFGPFRQVTEARRRVVWAGQILRLARQGNDSKELNSASRHLRHALALIDKAGHEL